MLRRRLKKPIYRILLLALLLSFMSSAGVYIVEHGNNPQFSNIIDLLLFWVVVITTVGAAIQPLTTTEGEVFFILAMVSGTFMYFTAISEVILSVKETYDSPLKGTAQYRGSNHVVIVGYNNMALGIIHLLDRILTPETDIVLVTSRIETNPDFSRVVFIKDHPATTTALSKAKIESAKLAIILSNEEVSADKLDVNTMLIGGMIEEINDSVHTIVELSTPQFQKHLDEFKIDDTITFDELLEDTRHRDKKPKLLQKFSKEVIDTIVREEYR